jgi:hypothetical protein
MEPLSQRQLLASIQPLAPGRCVLGILCEELAAHAIARRAELTRSPEVFQLIRINMTEQLRRVSSRVGSGVFCGE